jgi:very-short-patch-repair endonuclease
MSDIEIAQHARTQHGLVSRRQALMFLSAKQIERRLRVGALERVREGVYRVAGAPPTWLQSLLGACLAAGADAHASHHAAAQLWGFERFFPDGLEITIPTRRRVRLAGVRVHNTELPTAADITRQHGIPVSSPARTLRDLTAVVPSWVVEHAVDEALSRKLTSLAQLRRVAEPLQGRGRSRCTVMRDILDRRSEAVEPGESPQEHRLARLLVREGLPRPVQQHQVRLGSRTVRIDLAYPDARVAIEYDGWEFHSTRSAFDADRARANDLVLLGWDVLRFTSASSDSAIVETVRTALLRPCVEFTPSQGA